MNIFLRLFNYLLFAGTRFFAAAAPAIGGGNGDAGTNSGSTGTGVPGSGQGSPGTGGADSGGGPQAGQGTQGSDNIRQLREAYEGIKAKYEPWDKLGIKPEQVTQFQSGYQQVYGEVSGIAGQLGYSEQDVAEAIQAKGLLPVLDFLRNQAWEQEQANAGNQDVQQRIDLQGQMEELVNQAVGPIQQRENLRMTNEANALFDRTVHQLAVDSFKAEGLDVANIPQDEMFMLTTSVSEILKYDPEALKALKFEGKTAAIQKAFQEARNHLDKYYLARSGRTRIAPTPRPGAPQQPGTGRPTLDQIIDNPSVIDEAQGRRGSDGRYR